MGRRAVILSLDEALEKAEVQVHPFVRMRQGKLEKVGGYVRHSPDVLKENLKDSIKYLKSRLKKLKDDDPRRAGYEKELRTYTRMLERYRKKNS